MRLIDADKVKEYILKEGFYCDTKADREYATKEIDSLFPTVEAIPIWYIIRWYEKRYKLGSTVADDWERGFLKEKIVEMHGDFKNEKYLDNKQESGRFAQMVKEVIELYNDWEKENEHNKESTLQTDQET